MCCKILLSMSWILLLYFKKFTGSLKKYLFYWFTWLFWVLTVTCRIFSCYKQTLSCGMWDLVPWPGMEPGPHQLGAWSLSHWTTREVPLLWLLEPLFRILYLNIYHNNRFIEHIIIYSVLSDTVSCLFFHSNLMFR